jgi:hypothetical protein
MSRYLCLLVDMLCIFQVIVSSEKEDSKKPNYEQITLISINSEFDLQQKKKQTWPSYHHAKRHPSACTKIIFAKLICLCNCTQDPAESLMTFVPGRRQVPDHPCCYQLICLFWCFRTSLGHTAFVVANAEQKH